MPLLTIRYNGFHGHVTKHVFGTCVRIGDSWRVSLSKSGAKRFACRHSGCQCGEGLPQEFDLPLSAVSDSGTCVHVTGNYPQTV